MQIFIHSERAPESSCRKTDGGWSLLQAHLPAEASLLRLVYTSQKIMPQSHFKQQINHTLQTRTQVKHSHQVPKRTESKSRWLWSWLDWNKSNWQRIRFLWKIALYERTCCSGKNARSESLINIRYSRSEFSDKSARMCYWLQRRRFGSFNQSLYSFVKSC